MNPIPLSSPSGVLYGYACGLCHNVRASASSGGQEDGPRASLVEGSRLDAERCCQCSRCKKPSQHWLTRVCSECQPAEEAEQAVNLTRYQRHESKIQELRKLSLEVCLDVEAAEQLRHYMSDLSEAHWCTGWLSGLEYALWIRMKGDERDFGQGQLDEGDIYELNRLHTKCGGWWEMTQVEGECYFGGEMFVSTEAWLKQLEERLPLIDP